MEIFDNKTKIEIFRKFDLNRNFSNFWVKSDEQNRKFFKIFTEIKFFSKISQKTKFFENLDQNRNFSKFSKKSNLFESVTKLAIFPKFYQNRNFFMKIWPKSKFFEKIEIFRKFDPNRNFFKTLTKIENLKILTKFEIFSKIGSAKLKFFPKLD